MADTRVLIMTNQSPTSERLKALLISQGYQVTTATLDENPLFCVCYSQPHVVILELERNLSASESLIHQVRSCTCASLMVVAPLGKGSGRAQYLDAGADVTLDRPVNGKELLAQLRALLRRAHCTSRSRSIVCGEPYSVSSQGLPC